MMKTITISIITLLVCLILLAASIYAVKALNYDAEVMKLQKAIELQELQNKREQQILDARQRRNDAERLNVLDTSRLGAVVLATKYTVSNLWFLPPFLIMTGVMGLYAYKSKLQSLQTIALLRREDELDQTAAALRIVEKAVPSIAKALTASVPRQAQVISQPIIDVTPEQPALKAFSGKVHFSQTRLEGDYDDNNVLWGRDIETGGIRQQPLSDIESLAINGLQKHGKSTLLETIIHNCMLRKYSYGESVNTVLVDLHAGAPQDSLSSKLEAYCPGIMSLFHRTFLGEDEIENELVAYLDGLFDEFKPGTTEIKTKELVIIIDEYTETVSNLGNGAEIEALVKRLFNRRKYGVRLVLAMFESSKSRNSAKGLNVSKMAVSKALFRMDSAEGKRFLKDAEGCHTLDKGEYMLQTPGDLESSRIQAPLLTGIDFEVFSKFCVPGGISQAKNEENKVNPAGVKKYINEEKISQNALAQKAGVSKSDLSRWLNRKHISAEKSSGIVAALEAILLPQAENVINMQQYR